MTVSYICVPDELMQPTRTNLATAGLVLTEIAGGVTQASRYVLSSTFDITEETRRAAATVNFKDREMQVLLGMAAGKSNATIGRGLGITEDTVKTHARRLFRKLGAIDRANAVAIGYQRGLLVVVS